MRLSQMCDFFASIHVNGKLKKHGFNYHYQHPTIKNIPAIGSINIKNQNIKSISPCHRQ